MPTDEQRETIDRLLSDAPSVRDGVLWQRPIKMLPDVLQGDEMPLMIDAATFASNARGLVVLTSERILYLKSHAGRLRDHRLSLPLGSIESAQMASLLGRGRVYVRLKSRHGLLRRRGYYISRFEPVERAERFVQLLNERIGALPS